jgi:Domain of unknown function (DUF4349)
MKNFLLTLCLLVFIIACKNESKNTPMMDAKAPQVIQTSPNIEANANASGNFTLTAKDSEISLQAADSNQKALLSDSDKPQKTEPEQATISSKITKPSPSVFEQISPNRKIIRTADLRFRVNNTEKATYNVENITKRFDGFVTETQLNSRIAEQTKTPISTDSVMEITKYEIENTMTLRVKNSQLDTVLAEITRIYAFLDHRHVRANDVTVEYMMDALKAKIREQSARRIQLATDEKGKKLSDIVNAEQTTVDMNDAAIEKEGSNMRKDFDTEYSTITLAMYQDVVIQSVVKVNPSVYAHTPSIWYRLSDSFRGGWVFVLDLMVGLVAIWPLFVFIGLGYWGYRRLSGGLGWNPLAFKK